MNQSSDSTIFFNWLNRQINNHNIVLLEHYHVSNSKPRWHSFNINEWLKWIIHLTYFVLSRPCQESQTAVSVVKLIMNLLNNSFYTFTNPWRQPLGQNHGGTWKVSNQAYNFWVCFDTWTSYMMGFIEAQVSSIFIIFF